MRTALAVIVPACNEANTIASCVRAIEAACEQCVSARECWIVVVADRCDDGTAELALETLGALGEVIPSHVGSAGAARGAGCAAALQRFSALGYRASEIWLANTDADTWVPPDWLEQQLMLARAGARAVAGTVSLAPLLHRGRDISRLLMSDYLVQADGSHSHVHGANLGVSAEAYLDVGGWTDAALAEDHSLWSRLRARGWPLTATASLCVQTSARLRGRADGGFASTLSRKVEALHG